MKKSFKVEGMSCNHCKMAVKKALLANGKITDVKVDLESKTVEIECDSSLSMDKVKTIIDEAGYSVID
ncbi:MAG: heavy-metal-associated domain-containing protein [Clostridia bacterium]